MESLSKMEKLILTSENYYSKEADEYYCSVSQYKDFYGKNMDDAGCECYAMAKIRREVEEVVSTPLMVGSYVDAYFEGTLATFAAQHPEIYSSRGKTAGELKSEYRQASVMIDRATRDPLFMKYMEGDKQVIMVGEIEGVPFKIKIDSTDGNRITDLKTVRSISEAKWVKDSGEKLNFAEYWKYDLQGAIYQEIYRQNTGDILPFFICAISKDKTDNIPHPRIVVTEAPPMKLKERLEEVKSRVHHIQALKSGDIDPFPCGVCDWCADNLPLDDVVSFDQLTVDLV